MPYHTCSGILRLTPPFGLHVSVVRCLQRLGLTAASLKAAPTSLQGLQDGSMLCNLAKAGALSAKEVGGHSALGPSEDRRHRLCCFPLVQCRPVKCAASEHAACCRCNLSVSASMMSAWYLQRLPGKSSLLQADSDWSRLQQVGTCFHISTYQQSRTTACESTRPRE